MREDDPLSRQAQQTAIRINQYSIFPDSVSSEINLLPFATSDNASAASDWGFEKYQPPEAWKLGSEFSSLKSNVNLEVATQASQPLQHNGSWTDPLQSSRLSKQHSALSTGRRKSTHGSPIRLGSHGLKQDKWISGPSVSRTVSEDCTGHRFTRKLLKAVRKSLQDRPSISAQRRALGIRGLKTQRRRQKKILRPTIPDQHRATHDAKGILCACGSQFTGKAASKNYRRHVEDILHSDKFKCTVCEYSTPRKEGLVQHMLRKHQTARRKDFRCSICHYSTTRQYNLVRHIQTVHQRTHPLSFLD